MRTVHVRVTTILERFRPVLHLNVEMKNKLIYAKGKRPGADPKPSACDLPSATYSTLQAKSLQLILKDYKLFPWNYRLNIMHINILDSIVFCYSEWGFLWFYHYVSPLRLKHECLSQNSGLRFWLSPYLDSTRYALRASLCFQRRLSKLRETVYCSVQEQSCEWQNPTLYCPEKPVLQDLPGNRDYLNCCFSHALIKFWLLGSSVFLSWMGNLFCHGTLLTGRRSTKMPHLSLLVYSDIKYIS